jgi:hypothetical protein
MSGATRNLALFTLANILLLNLGLPHLLRAGQRQTAWADTVRVLGGPKTCKHDSWHPMNAAVWCLRLLPDRPLYDTLFFDLKTKFQYPPTSLLVMYPILHQQAGLLARLGVDWYEVLSWVSWVLVFVTAACVADVLRSLAAGAPGTPAGRGDHLVLTAAGVVLTLTYYPVVHAYGLGQIQVWLNGLFAAALWCWVRGWRAAAGALAGLLCLIKPQYAVLLLWGVLRRQGRFVLAAGITAAAGLGVSLALIGPAHHLNYFRVLSFLSHHGEAYYPNQSLNGLLNRLLGNGNNLKWDGQGFAPYHPVVYAGTMAGSLALLALALLGPVRRPLRGSALDLGMAAVCCTLASPVAWDHHYGVFLPVYAVLFDALRQGGAGRGAWLALGTSFALTANLFLFTNRWAATPVNFVQSYMLFGGLLAVGLLHHLRCRASAHHVAANLQLAEQTRQVASLPSPFARAA